MYYDVEEMQRQGKTMMDYHHADEEPPKNPNFREDLELNLSNSNMVHIMSDVLGFSGDSSEGYLIPINEFIARATYWLRQSIDKPSAEVPIEITKGEGGPTMVDMGRREGYANETVMRAVKIAREGKQAGATHIAVS